MALHVTSIASMISRRCGSVEFVVIINESSVFEARECEKVRSGNAFFFIRGTCMNGYALPGHDQVQDRPGESGFFLEGDRGLARAAVHDGR